jgi:stage II sporulation protein D
MPEAVMTAARTFAPPARGAVSSSQEALVPRETMHTPHATSQSSHAPSASPRRARRRGKLALAGALVLLVLLTVAGPAAALSMQYAFTVEGHGWGHGVGMSQWGAYGYAKHGWVYKDILKHYYTGIALSNFDNSVIRVNLRSGLSAVKLSCPRDYTVQGSGAAVTIPAGTTATTRWTSLGYRVVAGSLRRTFTAAPTFAPTSGALRLITTTDLGDDGAYRGAIRVMHTGGGLMMINHVPLESYLRGVIPHEVSPSWPREALKTQACAARAFALGSRQPDKSWDVYCDVRDQAYVGIGIEDSRTDAAVRDTAGVCPTYGGKPIVATYFSCSGGQTESVKYVWGGSYPYLKGVSDPYDYYGSLHDWGPLRRTSAQIGGPLGASGTVRAVYTLKRGDSPRIVKAAILGSTGTSFIDGGSLRMKLGLNSSWAIFTSMGVSPAARDGASVTAGSGITLKGRLYPALADGAKVYLHSYYGGAWHTTGVVTVRTTENLPGSYVASYSAYSVAVTPSVTTKYYFSSAKAKSPTTTIRVN